MATKEEILQELQRRNEIEALRAKQKKYNVQRGYNDVKRASSYMNKAGQGLEKLGTKFNNPTMQNLGGRLQTYSGQPGLNNLKQTGISKVQGLFGNGATTGATQGASTVAPTATTATTAGTTGASTLGTTGAGTASTLGATGATTGAATGATAAGTTAGTLGATGAATGAGTAAAGTAAAGSAAAGTGAAAAGGATAAAGASAAVPVAGWIAAAAILAANAIKSKKQKEAAKAMQADQNNMAQMQAQDEQNFNQMVQDNAQKRAEHAQEGYSGQLPQIGQNYKEDNTINNIMDKTLGKVGLPTPQELNENIGAQKEGLIQKAGLGNIIGKDSFLGSLSPTNGILYGNEEGTTTGGAAPVQQQEPLPDIHVNNDGSSNVYSGNTLDAIESAKGFGANQQQIDSMLQGLNGGNKDMAYVIDQYGINKPKTKEEIAQAQQGQFNNYNAPVNENGALEGGTDDKSMKAKIADILGQVKAGYKENSENGFTPQNWIDGKKSAATRIGEAIGTGQRIMSNPLTQGLIAGAAYGASEGDGWYGLRKGVEWAQDKAKSDYYGKQLDPNYKPTVFGPRYDSKDYNAQQLSAYRDAMIQNTQTKTDQQGYKTQATNLFNLYKAGALSPEEYNAALGRLNDNYSGENYATDANITNVSNDTRKVDETIRTNKVKEGIQQQNANTNSARVGETARHNKVSEAQGAQRLNQGQKGLALKEQQAKQKQINDGLKSGTLVKMQAPNGEVAVIPVSQRQKYERMGAKVI